MLKRFGLLAANRPWWFVGIWIGIVAISISFSIVGISGQNVFDRLSNEAPSVSSDSQKADDLLKGIDTKEKEQIFLLVNSSQSDKESLSKPLKQLGKQLKQEGYTLVSPAGIPQKVIDETPALSQLVAKNGNSFLNFVTVSKSSVSGQTHAVNQISDAFNKTAKLIQSENPTVKTYVGGSTAALKEITQQSQSDLEKGELISLPIALFVLLIVFAGFLAAGMPLIGAGVSIVAALGSLFGFSYIMDIDTTVLNILTVIGLGLSIDYGLLMVSRFREIIRLKPSESKENIREAVADTVSTAGRTVIFSGLTVAIATSGLMLFEPSIMKSIAIASSVVVLLAVVASISLLPALFSLLGKHLINPSPIRKIPGLGRLLAWLGDVAPAKGIFSKLTFKVQRHPILVAVSTIFILLLLGSSVAALNVSNNGTKTLSSTSTQGILFDTLDKQYPSFHEADISLVSNHIESKDLSTLVKFMEDDKEIKSIAPITKVSRQEVLHVSVKPTAQAKTVVNSLREEIEKIDTKNKIYVTGSAARDIDFVNSLVSTSPWVALIIMLATTVLLFLMTGSLVVPLKAIVLSILSLGASVGVLVWGFQEGNLSGLLHFDPSSITGISPLILVLVLVFGFGLAMDYEMFLISRIKEYHDQGSSTNKAVQSGLQSSGRIITSAALVIVLVFLGFALGDMLMIKQIGVALAVAVIIDATFVRCLLMPALITLLGDKVWWAPKLLKRVHAKIGVQH